MSFETPEAFEEALADLPGPNEAHRLAAGRRQDRLTKPPGSLGRLEEIALHLAGWQPDGIPRAKRIKVVVFAGNHGVTAQGVSPYPASVTRQMVTNFQAGGAAINAISGSLGLELHVVPLELETPTNDIMTAPAMSASETLSAINRGTEVVDETTDILVLGEMGIGNTTIAAALCAAAFGGTGKDWAGPGTGHDTAGVAKKAAVIDKAIARADFAYRKDKLTAFEVLREVGGRETAAIAGAILAARHQRIPVILDGFVVTASIAPMFAANPEFCDHCIAGHTSAEPAHVNALRHMRLEPLLELGMRLGEGTGAALASAIIRAAVAAHNKMATFEQAAVENRPDAE